MAKFTSPRTPQNVSKDFAPGAIFDLTKCVTSHAASSCCKPTTIASYNEVGRLEGSVQSQSEIFPNKFPGFYGRRFRVVTKYYPPFVTLSNGSYSGLCIELLEVLARTLNFSYDLFEVPDGKFGIINESGLWNGMIGMVHRKDADMAAAGLTITADRRTAVDFSFPYWEEPSGILIRRPGEGSKILSLLKPLQWSVWVAIIFEVLLAAGVIYVCTACTNHLTTRHRDTTMTSFENCLWYTFGALVNQSATAPTTPASRVVASALWFVTVAVYAAFTGNMVAILAVEKRTLPFSSLEEMVQQKDYTWGTEDGIVQMMVFQTAKGGVYSEIWDGMTSHSGSIVGGSEAGFRKTKTENYAFIGDKTYLDSYAAGDSDLILLPEEFYKVGFGFALPKDWPYTEYINDVVMKLVECGIVKRWKQKHWPRSLSRATDTRLFTRIFTLVDMEGNFFVIGIGTIVALGVLIVECIRRPVRFSKVFRPNVPRLNMHELPTMQNGKQ
ncbi:Glutamate receptor ionotropic, delta-1 [Lamellibrachia satsuma]|nr:Glutamate receptor ionotropic, delta-1 [Lamellibrachia satsuma]